MIYLDTHVVIWLYFGHSAMLSSAAISAISANDVLISPMVHLELQYLRESKRHVVEPGRIISVLADDIGLSVCSAPFSDVTEAAMGITWTRDPFDRLIVAQANLASAPLVSRDRLIREHYAKALW